MSAISGQIAQPNDDAMNIKPAKKRGIMKIFGYAVVAFVVVIAGLTFFVNSATKAPVEVSNQFLNAMQASDATTAYGFFSTEAKTAVPADQFDAVVKQVGPILNANEKMTNKKVNATTGSAATAEVAYEIAGTDGKTYNIIVNLTKENGAWKVLNFDSNAK